MKATIAKLEAENSRFSKVKEITAEFQRQIQQISEEKEKFELLLHEQEAKNTELQTKTLSLESELMSNSRTIKELRASLELKSKETFELTTKATTIDSFSYERDKYEQKLREQQSKIMTLAQEIEMLGQKLQSKSFETENMRLKNMKTEDLVRLITRLQSEVRDWELRESFWKKEDEKNRVLIQELLEKLRRLSDQPNYQKENEEKSQKIEELENKLVLLSTEITRLQSEVNSLKLTLRSERDQANFLLQKALKEQEETFMRLIREKEAKINELLDIIEENKRSQEKVKRNFAEMKSKEERLAEAERSLSLLANEIQELNALLKRKDLEVEELKRKLQEKLLEIQTLELKIKNYEEEISHMSLLIAQKEQEMLSCKEKAYQMERSSATIEALNAKNQELTRKIQELCEEIASLQELLQRTQGIKEELAAKNKRIVELEEIVRSLTQNLQESELKCKEREINYRDLQEKYEKLERISQGYKADLERCEGEKRLLSQENESLKAQARELQENFAKNQGILQQAKETMDNMHERITKYETVILEIPGMEDQIEERDRKIRYLTEELQRIKALEEDMMTLIHENSALKEEIQGLLRELELEKSENNESSKSYSEKIAKLDAKIAELEERVSGMRKENETLRKQLAETMELLRKSENEKSKESENSAKLQMALAEIQSLNSLLLEKDRKLVDLQREKELLFEENETFKQEIFKLQMFVSELQETIRSLEREVAKKMEIPPEYDAKIRELEMKSKALMKEIEHLNELVLKRNEEIDTWRTKYAQMELFVNEIRLKDTFHREIERKLRDKEKENEELTMKLNEMAKELAKFNENEIKSRFEALNKEISAMKSEIFSLKNAVDAKSKEIETKNSECFQLKSEISRLLMIQENTLQREIQSLKENLRNAELLLEKEKRERENLWEKYKRLEKIEAELQMKDERINALEMRNQLLLKEIEEWKKRHESFQNTMEKEINKKNNFY